MKLIVIGSVAYDSLVTPAGKRERVLGGSASYFSLAASFFQPPGMVAVIGEDFNEDYLQLFEKHEIDLKGLQKAKGKTFHWSGHYLDDINEAKTIDTELNVFERFDPKLPEDYKDAKTVFLANIDPDLQLTVLEQVSNPWLIACDTMNFWITGKLFALKNMLKSVHLLIINDKEAKMLAEEENIFIAGKKIMDLGPDTLVIKRGEYGAVLLQGNRMFIAPAFPIERVIDPTGAGDSFAGGFVGYLHATVNKSWDNMKTALAVGTVMASFTVEDFSLDRLTTVTYADVESRYKKYMEYISIKAVDLGGLKSKR